MKLLVILFFTLLSFNAFSEGLPHTKLYAVTDGFCCGGEESDPHAVHGFEVMNNGFVLSGKSIDSEGTEEGFVIKFPDNLPNDEVFFLAQMKSTHLTGFIYLDPPEKEMEQMVPFQFLIQFLLLDTKRTIVV